MEQVIVGDDRLHIRGIRFSARCGTTPAEREAGSLLEVDLDLVTDLSKPGRTDRLEEAADYARLARLVVETGKGVECALIEKMAETLADHIMKDFPCNEVLLTVKKRPPLLDQVTGWIGVTIRRRRGG
jgi:7,8-dihydroneopterin aldolase/epimerase/oxygenase